MTLTLGLGTYTETFTNWGDKGTKHKEMNMGTGREKTQGQDYKGIHRDRTQRDQVETGT